jgi:hypothetical protein
MQIKVEPHIAKEKTQWGTVDTFMNQHLVFVLNEDTNQFVQCGFVGDTHFLPLSGFPQSACEQVAKLCEEQLGKPVAAGIAPPGLDELVAIVNGMADEEDDE